GDDLTRRWRAGDREAQLPLLAGLGDLDESFDHPVGAPRLGRELLGGGDVVVADELVALGAVPSGGPGALVGPGPLRAGPFGQGAAGLGVLLVALACLGAGTLAFAEVGVVAAAVEVPAVLVAVELEDLGGGAGQELAVVADHDDAGVGV